MKITLKDQNPEVKNNLNYEVSFFKKADSLLNLVVHKVPSEESTALIEQLQRQKNLVESYRFKLRGPQYDYGNRIVEAIVDVVKKFKSLERYLDDESIEMGDRVLDEIDTLTVKECRKFLNPEFLRVRNECMKRRKLWKTVNQ